LGRIRKALLRSLQAKVIGISMRKSCFVALLVAVATFSQSAFADLYVLQVGDGAAALGATAAALTVKKFSDAGALQSSLPMPTAAGGGNNPITVRGNSTTESFMDLSTNGQYLVMGGYAATPGSADPSTQTSATMPRVIGRVDLSNFTAGGINTATALTDTYSANSFRSVASTDGTNFWLGGTGSNPTNGVRYTTLGSTTSTQVSNPPTNTRVVNIFNDASNQPQLYVSTGSVPYVGVSKVGTGLPTTATTTTLLPGMSADTSTNPMDFWFKDANTLYRANGTGGNQGIARFDFNSGTSNWDLAYILNPGVSGATGAGGLTGTIEGGQTVLYATNYLNELVKIIDTGASSTPTLLATAPANTTFRGIAFVASAVGLTGDYNSDGKVDAGDYVTWRKAEGTSNVLANDPAGGTIGPTQYTNWRANFGKPPGAGSGLEAASVPEPASAVLLMIGLVAFCSRRRSA
jgi:PEP-CTERM motif